MWIHFHLVLTTLDPPVRMVTLMVAPLPTNRLVTATGAVLREDAAPAPPLAANTCRL